MESRTLTLFDKSSVSEVEPFNEYKVIAKHTVSSVSFKDEVSYRDRYWLKTVANRLINPCDYSLYELKKNDTRFVEVDKHSYDTYHAIINGTSPVPFRSLETRVNNA